MTHTPDRRAQIVAEYDALPHGDLRRRALLEREGVTRNVVANWRSRGGLRRQTCSCGRPLDGAWRRCRTCDRAIEKDRHLRRTYGITLEDFERILASQGGVCAACRGLPPTTGTRSQRSFHVDHDHKSGKVRGILCYRCNVTLGCADDDVDRLLALAAYLT